MGETIIKLAKKGKGTTKENGKDGNKTKDDDEDVKGKACWIRFDNTTQMKDYIHKNTLCDDEAFFFFTVNVAKMKKASRWRRLEYKLRSERTKKKPKEKPISILHESEDWLTVYPLPWSRMTNNLACGVLRDNESHKWHNWDIEYPKDLFSLVGTLHQSSKGFSRENRNKQSIANCIVAVVMVEMYSLQVWNASILNSILRYGDKYLDECSEATDDEIYENTIEDFQKTLSVPPYNIRINYTLFVEGTLFVTSPNQFNLSKSLRMFFETHEHRNGIICCGVEGGDAKFLAFGRIHRGEYYMYDCHTIGPPMFTDKARSASYILRCLSLNRLLHVMTLTLRGGDFFMYHVEVVPPGEEVDEKEVNVTNYESGVEDTDGGKTDTETTGGDTTGDELEYFKAET